MQPLAAGRYERRAWRRQLRTVSLWTRSRVVVLCFRPVRLTISLPPSLSRSLSRWDDKTETSWPGPIRDALQSRILFTGARCPNKFLLFLIGSERNGSHRVGTGNSYRTQLIRLLNVAALLLLLLLFVLLLLVPIANSYPRVFWQISINVLLSHKSINYLFSDTKKNFINISTTYDSYFRCGIFGKLGETQKTERTCKQNKTREEKRQEWSCFFLLIDVLFGTLLRVPESQPAINCALLRIPLLFLRSSFHSCRVSKTNSKNDHAEGGGRAGLCAAGPGQHGEVHGQLAQAVSAKNRYHNLLQVATTIATELSQPCATEFKVSSLLLCGFGKISPSQFPLLDSILIWLFKLNQLSVVRLSV